MKVVMNDNEWYGMIHADGGVWEEEEEFPTPPPAQWKDFCDKLWWGTWSMKWAHTCKMVVCKEEKKSLPHHHLHPDRWKYMQITKTYQNLIWDYFGMYNYSPEYEQHATVKKINVKE